jgi:hypothetical protein
MAPEHLLKMSRRKVLTRTGGLLLVPEIVLADAVRKSVIAQAGRRVDAPEAQTARFPAANVNLVKERIKTEFLENEPVGLVTSAACGTDLLALETAEQMNVERFILLPSKPAAFRASSVVDRPGDWGDLFDRMIKTSHVEVLTLPEGQQGYLETNLRLLDKGQSLAKTRNVETRAMVVWNKQSRGPDDVTGHFLEQARLRHSPIIEISTL